MSNGYQKAVIGVSSIGICIVGIVIVMGSLGVCGSLKKAENDLKDLFGPRVNQSVSIPQLNFGFIIQVTCVSVSNGCLMILTACLGGFGAFYEFLWMILLHIVTMGTSMTFTLFVAVSMIIETKRIENQIGGNVCDLIVCPSRLEYLFESATLPLSNIIIFILFVQGSVIVNSLQLFFHLRKNKIINFGFANPRRSQNLAILSVSSRSISNPQILTIKSSTPQLNSHDSIGFMFRPPSAPVLSP